MASTVQDFVLKSADNLRQTSWSLYLVSGVVGGVAYIVWKILVYFIIDPWRSPLRNLIGPPAKGFFGNHMERIMNPMLSAAAHDEYVKQYGRSFRVRGFGWFDDRLLTLDPRAMSYVINNQSLYEKPWQSQRLISNLIGNGIYLVFLSEELPLTYIYPEDCWLRKACTTRSRYALPNSIIAPANEPRLQRKVMNPAFSHQNMKAYSPIFLLKAHELRRRWLGLTTGPNAVPTVDMVHWISRATFDVIGLAGFDYVFDAIKHEDNEVYLAYKEMFDIALHQHGVRLISIFFPIVDTLFPTEATRVVKKSHKVIYGVGNQLVQDKKRQFLEGKADEGNSKSMLSLLIKSNLSNTIPEQQITDADIMDQINTFFFAGSDTTSLALAWTFLLLAEHPDMQTQLREEILASSGGHGHEDDGEYELDFNVIDNLPYLEKVVKESLRLIPPVHSSIRVALQDDVIPTQYPVKMTDGSERYSIPIQKGQYVHVPMEGFNLDKNVWGEDAWEFKPDRWDHLPEAVKSQPGLYQNIMTFSAGPRSCIGMRFSIMEMKTFLYVLVSAFTFEPAPGVLLYKRSLVLTRPYIRGRFKEGSQLPLVVKPYHP
ncbi:hypothetical protein FRB99_000505 [Tulasnella sp. 403]|nr:hypothetical protein FRB99_000505 [Tulasnella sp. 403]